LDWANLGPFHADVNGTDSSITATSMSFE
jgi:hypothetical protein